MVVATGGNEATAPVLVATLLIIVEIGIVGLIGDIDSIDGLIIGGFA